YVKHAFLESVRTEKPEERCAGLKGQPLQINGILTAPAATFLKGRSLSYEGASSYEKPTRRPGGRSGGVARNLSAAAEDCDRMEAQTPRSRRAWLIPSADHPRIRALSRYE